MRRYTTRAEAIQDVIIDPIECGDATADEFDIDAIADKVIAFDPAVDEKGVTHLNDQYFYCKVDVDEFWKVVEDHAL